MDEHTHSHDHEHGGEMDLDAAMQLVEQHKQLRLQNFQEALGKLCEQYGVELSTTPVQVVVRLVG